jgi:hypothetical protein
MKISGGAFRIAGILVVLTCCGGCSTPGEQQAWAAIFQGVANQAPNSYGQYQMSQVQNQQFQQQQQIYNLQNPNVPYTFPVNPYSQ